MYEIRDGSDLSMTERQEVLDLLYTLKENDSIEIVTGHMIEMRNGGIFIDDTGPLSVEEAFSALVKGSESSPESRVNGVNDMISSKLSGSFL